MKTFSLLTANLLSCFLLMSVVVQAQDRVGTDKDLASKFATLINRPDVCEAYPWLSGDGLRLYFTTDREGGFGRLYFCSRNSVTENFGPPKPLSSNFPNGYYAATLTADELTIYASNQGLIYTSKRNSLEDQFSKPVRVNEITGTNNYAPAISPDGNELIITDNVGNQGERIVIHYRKGAAGTFIEVNRMVGQTDLSMRPGQFSKDGLSYYASVVTEKLSDDKNLATRQDNPGTSEKIIRFTREALNENFINVEHVEMLNSPLRNHQATMNEDETIFIVVTSAEDLWSKNEMRLINFGQQPIAGNKCELQEEVYISCKIPDIIFPGNSDTDTYFPPFEFHRNLIDSIEVICHNVCGGWGTDVSEVYIMEALPENKVQLKVYPNPFVNEVFVNIDNNKLNARFDLYDISGRKILTTKLNNASNRIQFNRAGSGVYIYSITDAAGKLISSGKLVKR